MFHPKRGFYFPLEKELRMFQVSNAIPPNRGPFVFPCLQRREELRNEFHLFNAKRVLRYRPIVLDNLTTKECHQLRRRCGILWPLWAQYAIRIQVRDKLDEEVRHVSPAVEIRDLRPVERAKYGHRLVTLVYWVRIGGSVSEGQDLKPEKQMQRTIRPSVLLVG